MTQFVAEKEVQMKMQHVHVDQVERLLLIRPPGAREQGSQHSQCQADYPHIKTSAVQVLPFL